MLDRDYTGLRLKRFFIHNYLPLFVSFELFALLSYPFFRASGAETNPRDLLGTALFFGEPNIIHYWYMQMLLGIYLFIPIIATFLHKISEEHNLFYLWILIAVSLFFILIIPTAVSIATWFNAGIRGEVVLGGFVGRGALGVLYMLGGYCIKRLPILSEKNSINSARWAILLLSFLLLWLLAVVELRETNKLFLVTEGYAPIAFTAFAFAWAMIKQPGLQQAPQWLASTTRIIATYSYGVYMTHQIVAKMLRNFISDDEHLLRVATSNPVSILIISFILVWLLGCIPFARKWLLVVKH